MPRTAIPPDTQLDRFAAAERLDILPGTLDKYRSRPKMNFPEPDGHTGRSPWWFAATIDAFDATRRGVGHVCSPECAPSHRRGDLPS